MASKLKIQDEKHLKILRELAALPSNRYCFECQQRGPTYIDVTVGSFVCTTCSGLLRGIHPPHRVKSITMTSFTPEEIDQIKSKGNEYCKQVWLGKYDPSTSLEIDSQNPSKLKEFLLQKYEDKKFYVEPEFVVKKPKSRAPSIPNNAATVTQSKSQTAIPTSSPSKLVQKPGWTSQTFSSVDKPEDSSPFSDTGKSESPTVESSEESSSFADFGSAFAMAASAVQQNTESEVNKDSAAAAPKPNVKKHAPPPPDRYAALADLDNQLHIQQQQQQPPPVMPSMTATVPLVDPSGTFIWCSNLPGATAIALPAGVPTPFGQTIPTWSAANQVGVVNPFQTMAPQLSTQFPKPVPVVFAPMANGGTGDRVFQANGSDAYWTAAPAGQQWITAAFPAPQQYAPWPKNVRPDAANPFVNGTGPSAPQNGSTTNNPFL